MQCFLSKEHPLLNYKTFSMEIEKTIHKNGFFNFLYIRFYWIVSASTHCTSCFKRKVNSESCSSKSESDHWIFIINFESENLKYNRFFILSFSHRSIIMVSTSQNSVVLKYQRVFSEMTGRSAIALLHARNVSFASCKATYALACSHSSPSTKTSKGFLLEGNCTWSTEGVLNVLVATK